MQRKRVQAKSDQLAAIGRAAGYPPAEENPTLARIDVMGVEITTSFLEFIESILPYQVWSDGRVPTTVDEAISDDTLQYLLKMASWLVWTRQIRPIVVDEVRP